MKAKELVGALKGSGYRFVAGVPCSLLKSLVSEMEGDQDLVYVPATREDSAVGMAVGSFLGGRKSVVLMQNSGLGTAVNALASLPCLYKIPLMLIVSWRGRVKDAPEHRLMGRITLGLLESLEIPYLVLSPEWQTRGAGVAGWLQRTEAWAGDTMKALVVTEETFNEAD